MMKTNGWPASSICPLAACNDRFLRAPDGWSRSRHYDDAPADELAFVRETLGHEFHVAGGLSMVIDRE